MKHCFDDGLRTDATSGWVTVRLHIAESGEATTAEITESTGISMSVADCIVAAARGEHYPYQGPGGTTATVPFHLQRESPDSPCADAPSRTKSAQTALDRADASRDPKEKVQLARVSLGEYKLAASGWLECLRHGASAAGADRSRYFLADALHGAVRLEAVLNAFDSSQYAGPTSAEIVEATNAAIAVRDSAASRTFVDNAARFVDDLSNLERQVASRRLDRGK